MTEFHRYKIVGVGIILHTSSNIINIAGGFFSEISSGRLGAIDVVDVQKNRVILAAFDGTVYVNNLNKFYDLLSDDMEEKTQDQIDEFERLQAIKSNDILLSKTYAGNPIIKREHIRIQSRKLEEDYRAHKAVSEAQSMTSLIMHKSPIVFGAGIIALFAVAGIGSIILHFIK